MTDYKREGLKADLTKSLEARGMNTPVFRNMVNQYLTFGDILEDLNAKADEIEGDNSKIKLYLAYVGESRRVLRSMHDLLDWLGFPGDPEPEKSDL